MEAIKAVPEKREGTKEKSSGVKKPHNSELIQQNPDKTEQKLNTQNSLCSKRFCAVWEQRITGR